MSPTFPIFAQFDMSDQHNMHKRAIPLIPVLGALAVGTAGANIRTSVVNGGGIGILVWKTAGSDVWIC